MCTCQCLPVLALVTLVALVQAQDATITLTQTEAGVDVYVGGSINDVSGISGTFVRRRRNQETRPVLRLGAPSTFIVSPFDNLGFNLLSPFATNIELDASGCSDFPMTSTTYLINATDPNEAAPVLGVFDAAPPSLYIVTISDRTADHSYDWSGTIFNESFSTMGILEGSACSLGWTGTSGIPQTISLVAASTSTQSPTPTPTNSPAPKRKGIVATAWDLLKWAFQQLAKALKFVRQRFSGEETNK